MVSVVFAKQQTFFDQRKVNVDAFVVQEIFALNLLKLVKVNDVLYCILEIFALEWVIVVFGRHPEIYA